MIRRAVSVLLTAALLTPVAGSAFAPPKDAAKQQFVTLEVWDMKGNVKGPSGSAFNPRGKPIFDTFRPKWQKSFLPKLHETAKDKVCKP